MDAQVANLVVDLRIVNDFADQIDRLGRWKYFAGRVGEVDHAHDAVAKPEFLRQLDRQPAVGGENPAMGADAVHQFTAIMGDDLRLNRFHHVGPAKVDFLRHAGRLN